MTACSLHDRGRVCATLSWHPDCPRLQALERALRAASSQFNTDSSNPTVGFVRLSGALHCDERSAFQEIAHQLCRCLL